tara:strand:+ start:7307 stop:7459 length:153 start_codon:yes stop_codon:yes gene_type:complete
MSKKTIEVEVSDDCLDSLVVQELKEMRECLMEQADIDAFNVVIKFYEGAA